MVEKISTGLGLIGVLFFLWGLVSAISLSSTIWYSYFVFGGTLFFAWINKTLKNESLFQKNLKYILKTYIAYLLFTVIIELIGRFIFELWLYPGFNTLQIIFHVFLIGYPFAFVSSKISSSAGAFVITVLASSLFHEIPNTFAREWVYLVPYIALEIFRVNILVILGWAILVAVPLITKNALNPTHTLTHQQY
jgi:hypothetical protein